MNWKVTNHDMALLQKIARRAFELEYSKDETNICMTLTACHANGCPLRLQGLLDARDFDFAHDVLGIMGHINTRTGKLRKHFNPRYAVEQ